VAVRITYEEVSDAAMVYLQDPIPPGGAPNSQICDLEVQEGAVILLLSSAYELVGLEVLGASKLLPREVLEQSERLQ
jgi:hypothetical protein